jgi:hypothetical protein
VRQIRAQCKPHNGIAAGQDFSWLAFYFRALPQSAGVAFFLGHRAEHLI